MKQIIPFHKEIMFRTMIGEITSISLEHTLSFTSSDSIQGDFIVSGSYKMTEASQLEEDFEYRIPIDITVNDRYNTENSKIEIDDFYYEIVNDEILKVNIDVMLDGVEEEPKIIEVEQEKETISLDEEVIKSHLEKEIAEPVRAEEEVQVVNGETSFETKEEMQEVEKVEEKVETVEENPVVEIEEPVKEAVIRPVLTEPAKEMAIARPAIEKEEMTEAMTAKQQSPQSIGSIFSVFKDTEETFATYSVYIVRENDSLENILEKYQTTREELGDYNNLDEMKVGTKLIIPAHTVCNENSR